MNQVEKFLARLRDSHPDMEHIYTQGGCFELFLIMRTIWPQARCYYAFNPGHVYIEIDGLFYDIRGKYVRPPNGAVDFAKTEPHIMAGAHRWSKRSFKSVGRLMTARELLGIPEQEDFNMWDRIVNWPWLPATFLGVASALQVLSIVLRHYGF